MTTGTTQSLPIGQLRNYHRNARKGDVGAIKESIITNGLYKPLLVNKGTHTGRPWEVLAGNHTLAALQDLHLNGQTTHTDVPCWVIDVNDTQATRIVLADNKTADNSTYNNEALLDLLVTLPDLDGTGYQLDDLDALAGLLDNEPDDPDPPAHTFNEHTTITLHLPPPLATQWFQLSAMFDSPEEALEHLLDHQG